MDDKFRALLEDPQLYPASVVEKFGISGSHWNFETWLKRERSMRHDMVCLLLCNMETLLDAPITVINEFMTAMKETVQKRKITSILGEEMVPKKKMKKEDQDNDEESDFSEEDEDDEECQSEGDDKWEDIEEAELKSYLDQQSIYRYKLLEGLAVSARLQNHFLKQWKCDQKQKTYDIVDSVEKKLIEVKVTLNFNARIREYNEHPDTDNFTSLILINPNTQEIQTIDKNQTMPGESKVTSWLLKRKMLMDGMGITDDPIDDESELSSFVFTNEKLNELLLSYREFYTKHLGKQIPKIPEINDDLTDFTPLKLFNALTKDHLTGDYDPIVWTGKILPIVWKEKTETEGTDIQVIDHVINLIDDNSFEYEEGDENMINFFDELKSQWDNSEIESKNFCLFDAKNKSSLKKIPDSIKFALGIGKKNLIHAETENMVQEEYGELKKRKYCVWFDEMMELLGKDHEYKRLYASNFEFEKEDRLDMHKKAQEKIEMTLKSFGLTNAALLQSEYINTFSRLSGAYISGASKTGSHSKVVIMPIVSNLKRKNGGEEINKKLVTGVLIRGPCHARSMSDKINIVTIEMVNSKFKLSYINKGLLLKSDTCNFKILIRQNAYKKIDGPYLMFMSNSVFNPINMLGEIVINIMCRENQIDIENQTMRVLSDVGKKNYFVNRIVENQVMCAIGNSRDEEYFSMLRKLCMILLCFRRGDSVHTLDFEEFCKCVNEGIIDNPFSMYFHNSVLYVLARLSSGLP